jgi:hypothetical protein
MYLGFVYPPWNKFQNVHILAQYQLPLSSTGLIVSLAMLWIGIVFMPIRIRIFIFMPIQIRIRIGIKTMPIHMRILPQV